MPKIGSSANGFGKFCEVYEAVEVSVVAVDAVGGLVDAFFFERRRRARLRDVFEFQQAKSGGDRIEGVRERRLTDLGSRKSNFWTAFPYVTFFQKHETYYKK